MLRTLTLILLCALLVLPAHAADDPQLIPLGRFEHVRKGSVDHAYGHALELWNHGDRLVGRLQHWHADIEGNGGEFTDGRYDPQAGTLNFHVAVRRGGGRDETDNAVFNGRLEGGRVSGELTWEQGRFAGEQREALSLPLDRTEIPVPLRLSAWRNPTVERTLAANADCAAFNRAGRSAAVSSRLGPGPIELQATVARRGRLPFHSGPAAHCRTRQFIIRGDRVSVGVPFNGYRPITYIAKDGKVHRSWVDASALDIQPFQFE